MPAARAAASVPPTVVAPTAPWTAAAARSRGPALRASGPKRASSSAVSPTRTSPSRTPTVAGHGAGRAHLPLRLEPDLDALAGREAVRDERRLERDDGAAGGQRFAHLVGDADHAGRSISTKRLSSPCLRLVEAGAPVRRAARARSSSRPRAGTCAAATRGARTRARPR